MRLDAQPLLQFVKSFEENLQSKLGSKYTPETFNECLTQARGYELLRLLLLNPEFANPLAEAFGKRYPSRLDKHALFPGQSILSQLEDMEMGENFMFPHLLLETGLRVAPADKELLVEFLQRLHQKMKIAPGSWLYSGTIHASDPGHHPYCFQNARETLIRSMSEHPELVERVLQAMDADGPRHVWRFHWKKLCGMARNTMAMVRDTVEGCLPLTQGYRKQPPSPKRTPPEQLKRRFDALDRTDSVAVRTFVQHIHDITMKVYCVPEEAEQTSQAETQQTTKLTGVCSTRPGDPPASLDVCILNDLRNVSNSPEAFFDKSSLCRHEPQASNPNVATAILPCQKSPLTRNPSAFFAISPVCKNAIQTLHRDTTLQEGRSMRTMTL